jgi:hypothetical protein
LDGSGSVFENFIIADADFGQLAGMKSNKLAIDLVASTFEMDILKLMRFRFSVSA